MSKRWVPGSIWDNHGRWYWMVKLPGENKRRNIPLKMPGDKRAMSVDHPKSLAESIAISMWENAERKLVKGYEPERCSDFNSVAGAYLKWAEGYYRRADGSVTQELARCGASLRRLRPEFGDRPVNDISLPALIAVRDGMEGDLSRKTINAYVSIWKRCFKWALERGLCSSHVKAEVEGVGYLKEHRSSARECDPVRPVKHWVVKRTCAELHDVLRTMVLVQELCGARPDELCRMKAGEIRKRRDVWIYMLDRHKNRHKNIPRVIVFGPRAQVLLSPLLDGLGKDKYVFSPVRAMKAMKPNFKGAGEFYDQYGYRQAVHRACKRAGVELWNPNQLRHSCGTRIRKLFGYDMSRAVLGHARRVGVTDNYTFEAMEREFILKCSKVMRRIG